ncbi:MAG: hypothetical protein B7O98_04115 [Zestosphaera tikiterensis]|uniref:AAA+ ATPase domain-containing protein n=1 Tax=Zestosphaera tikiterensis TaxID=1973259 RepID=A0A2R7Y7V7_9CREN|nr:MAG: hypothetical protein B7O98_04115 [Zestosphaera tikiterensis]
MSDVEYLVRKSKEFDKAAISKLISAIEENPLKSFQILKYFVRDEFVKTHVIGFTGSAGVGKSTLVSAVTQLLSQEGYRVAILAVDPKSPFTGGAILGDRVRMKSLPQTAFMRSMTTYEEEALPLKVLLCVELLEGIGFDYILIETPGVGQFNTRVVKTADTVAVVLMPEAGDEIQALKAGIMEIGDIYVINKADLPGANITFGQVEFAISGVVKNGWTPKIVMTSAISLHNVKPLIQVIKERENHIMKTDFMQNKRKARRSLELELTILETVKEGIKEILKNRPELLTAFEKVLKGNENLTNLLTTVKENLINIDPGINQ